MHGRDADTTITEPRQPSPGQERARKRKTSQDREPTKLNSKPSERREEKVRDEPGSSPLELIKKVGEQVKSVMRTSPPPERAPRVGEQARSQVEGQRDGGTRNGSSPNPNAGEVGARQLSIASPEIPEVTGSVGDNRERQIYISPKPHGPDRQ